MLVKKRRKVLKKGGDKQNLKPVKHAQQCMSQTKKQTIRLKMQVHSAPYTAISKILTWTKLCKKYLKNPFQLVWILPSKDRHTQTQCRPHLALQLLVIAHQSTSTCFCCGKGLREFGDLCFIIKSRRPIGRDENGVIIILNKWKMCTFTCQKFVSDRFSGIFWPATHHCKRLIVICYRKSKLT